MLRTTAVWIALVTSVSLTVVALGNEALLKGLDANKKVSLVINGVQRGNWDVGAGGEVSIPLNDNLDAALDPNKNYVVYKVGCNRYQIFISGSNDEKRCRDENKDAKPGDPCGPCVPVLWITKGQVSNQPPTQSSSGMSTIGKAGTVAAAIGAVGIGYAVAAGGNDRNAETTPPLAQISGRAFLGSVPITSNACNANLGNPATLRMEIGPVNPDGSMTVRIIHVSANNTTFGGNGRLVQRPDGSIAVTVDPAVVGTLSQRGEGQLNPQRTQATMVFTITRTTDGCTIVYSGVLSLA